MRQTALTFFFALTALLFLDSPSQARGGRGGGFHGGGRHMGSVRYHQHYNPRSYQQHHRNEPGRGQHSHQHGGYHRPAAHHPRPHPRPPAWGARVHHLPGSCARRWWRNRFWWYGAGMWYVEDDEEYVATEPPTGMIVHALPEGSVPKTLNGKTYYEYNGVWFKPVMSGGTSYMVVKPPDGG